jgi:hypothetical protein
LHFTFPFQERRRTLVDFEKDSYNALVEQHHFLGEDSMMG